MHVAPCGANVPRKVPRSASLPKEGFDVSLRYIQENITMSVTARKYLFFLIKNLTVCSLSAAAPMTCAQSRERVTIYAAASLKDGLDALLKSRENVTAIYAGSATLARQIEHGAPADIFVAADRDWIDYLERKNLLPQLHARTGQRSDRRIKRIKVSGKHHDIAGRELTLKDQPAPVQKDDGLAKVSQRQLRKMEAVGEITAALKNC